MKKNSFVRALFVAAALTALPLAGQDKQEEATKNAAVQGSNPNDPRASLKPGLYDAGDAIQGLQHISFSKKPDAFQPPPPAADASPMERVFASLGYANSDLAFQKNTLFQGNFYGIDFYDISNPAKPTVITTLVCPGGQGDVSVYGHLLFMSVEMPNGQVDCSPKGSEGLKKFMDEMKAKQAQAKADQAAGKPAPKPEDQKPQLPPADPNRFRGVRIFDISDLKNPKQVAAIQTCRGSHTHTLVPDPNDKNTVYIYVNETSFVRQSEELAGCSGEAPDKDPNTALFKIDVIQVPVQHPQDAKIVSSPRIFMDPRTGVINAVTSGGSHGKSPEDPLGKDEASDQCHDITVYPALGLAAGACSGNGLLLDIHDPVHPKRLDAVNDKNYSYWHSASFNNDGTKVLFTDEWGGGLQPRCRVKDPINWGADAIFALKNNKLTFTSYYKMPAAQGDTENCVAHNGSLLPVPGRDILVQAWYQGGISVVDFTDAQHPIEIAYYDRGAIDPKNLVLGGFWSAYYYNGYIYGSEIARGLDVFKLVPSKYLTQNEIDAANQVHFDELNVQSQPKLTWPSNKTVAKAYLDQLKRSQALPANELAQLEKAINNPGKLKAADFEKLQSASTKSPIDSERLQNLLSIIKSPNADNTKSGN